MCSAWIAASVSSSISGAAGDLAHALDLSDLGAEEQVPGTGRRIGPDELLAHGRQRAMAISGSSAWTKSDH